MYDYKKSKEIIESILKSPTKIVEKILFRHQIQRLHMKMG